MSTGRIAVPLISTSAPKFSLEGWIASASARELAARDWQRRVATVRVALRFGPNSEVAQALGLDEAPA